MSNRVGELVVVEASSEVYCVSCFQPFSTASSVSLIDDSTGESIMRGLARIHCVQWEEFAQIVDSKDQSAKCQRLYLNPML